MDNKTDGQNVGNLKGGLSVIQDFYLEFFGTLVPGVIAVTSVILLGLGFYYFITGDSCFIKATCEYVFKSWGFGLLYLIISYIMGAIAYRRNPKTPDTISSHRQWRATKEGSSSEEVGRLSVTFNSDSAIPKGLIEKLRFWFDREQWILRHAGHNIDYPYPHMRQYLYCRGFAHLAEYVPWCAGSGGSAFRESFEKGKCTKHYVNIIKQRLRNSGRSNLILDMMRNECNIRMLSSLWYILVFVRRMLFISMVVAAVAIPVKVFVHSCFDDTADLRCAEVLAVVHNNDGCTASEYTERVKVFDAPRRAFESRAWKRVLPASLPEVVRTTWFFFIVFAASMLIAYCQRSIEFGFHYVRTREKKFDRKDLFADIKGMANEFRETRCQMCRHYKTCHNDDETCER